MEWLSPWYSIVDDDSQTTGMEQELRRELATEHPLYGLPMRAVARRQDCDDVLFAIDDGTERFAVVHLTWTTAAPDRLPWPISRVYGDIATWVVECMRTDHEAFSV